MEAASIVKPAALFSPESLKATTIRLSMKTTLHLKFSAMMLILLLLLHTNAVQMP
jgi:hypothetical protein